MKVSVYDFKEVLRNAGIVVSSLCSDKLDIIRAGCELHILMKEDLIYIADRNTTVCAAQNRLSQRRRDLL